MLSASRCGYERIEKGKCFSFLILNHIYSTPSNAVAIIPTYASNQVLYKHKASPQKTDRIFLRCGQVCLCLYSTVAHFVNSHLLELYSTAYRCASPHNHRTALWLRSLSHYPLLMVFRSSMSSLAPPSHWCF